MAMIAMFYMGVQGTKKELKMTSLTKWGFALITIGVVGIKKMKSPIAKIVGIVEYHLCALIT